MTIKQLVEDSDTRAGRLFDLTVQALVLISLVSFSIETLPDLSSRTRQILRWTEIAELESPISRIEVAHRLALAPLLGVGCEPFIHELSQGRIDLPVALAPVVPEVAFDVLLHRVARLQAHAQHAKRGIPRTQATLLGG